MLWSFVIATTLISLMPGPSMVIIIMNAVDRGVVEAIQTILGVVVADAILLVLVLSGVGAILYASAVAFAVLKWFGVLYLIYLGIAQLRSRVDDARHTQTRQGNAFIQGLGTTILNPKIIGFLIVYFPQFLNHNTPVLQQLMVLGPLFLLIVFLVFLMCALVAGRIRGLLETRKGRVAVKNVTGVSLIGCGVLAAMS